MLKEKCLLFGWIGLGIEFCDHLNQQLNIDPLIERGIEMANTKTIQGYFGEKQVTKEEFVKQWKEHFGQFFHLATTIQDYDELQAMRDRIMELAGNRWEKIE